MSLMGVMMMVGIVVSDLILIVEFTRELRRRGEPLHDAITGCLPHSFTPHHDDHIRHLPWADALALALEVGSGALPPPR